MAGLLQVQDLDSGADRLRYRRRTLPELTELARREEEVRRVQLELADVTARRDDVARRQRLAEDELAAVERKAAEVESRLYSGSGGPVRELQAMQSEVEALGRRRSSLEDDALEAMTEREPLDAEVASLEGRRETLGQERDRLRAVVAEAQAGIDAELAELAAARGAAVEGIPPSLLSAYERLRDRLDGVGVARLVNGRCDGCHLSLSVTELARANQEPPQALLHCEQCGRILVR